MPSLALPASRSQRAKRSSEGCVYRNALTRSVVTQHGADVVRLVNLAVRTLRNKSVAWGERQRTRRHDPGLDKRLGVVDGHFMEKFIALAREPLHDAHVAG